MANETTKKRIANKRRLQGTVVSTKMDKTITVRVDRKVKHPKYGKIYTVSKKYKAHDEKGEANLNDVVEIVEVRPISADKRWLYVRTISNANA